MDNQKTFDNAAPLEQVGLKLHTDLRLVLSKGNSGFEIHLAPDDAIDLAVLLLKFANDIPGKHQELIRSLATIDQSQENRT